MFALRDGEWEALPPLRRPRAAGAAAVVGDRIVVMGGQDDGRLLDTTEVFDGKRWSEAANIPTPREHLAAASDGEFVYAVGGRALGPDKNSAALERYDPADDSWQALPDMPTARGGLGGRDRRRPSVRRRRREPDARAWATSSPTTSPARPGPAAPSMRTPRHGLASGGDRQLALCVRRRATARPRQRWDHRGGHQAHALTQAQAEAQIKVRLGSADTGRVTAMTEQRPDLKPGYYLLNTDGGNSGNPLGRAAIGALLRTRRLVTVAQISKAIGPATHNVAEYQALIEGLKLARDYGIQRIRVYMDSELVVDQVNGVSAVRQAHLSELHEVASSLAALFKSIRISWVPRELNAEADRLVNDALGAVD